MRTLMVLIALLGVALLVYGEWSSRSNSLVIHNDDGHVVVERARTVPNQPLSTLRQSIDKTTGFSCDARQHCSQMRSCEEATYFLRNCPGVKMDGDRDGIPCENQWCR